MSILILIFWLLLSYGIFSATSRAMRRWKRSWATLLFLLLPWGVAGAYIWHVSWMGCGANFSRMIAFQIIIASCAALVRYIQTRFCGFVGSLVLIASIPLIWLVIQTQRLHLYMIYDASLLDQRITILVGEATFLILAYLGWLVPQRRQNKDNEQVLTDG